VEDTTEARYQSILRTLDSLGDAESVAGMARFGITGKKVYGVSVAELRKMAKDTGAGHELAQRLWDSEIREARLLATMIDDPRGVTEHQMERWAAGFDNWETCDQCCMNLFENTPHAYRKAAEWACREEEFVRRAGFVLMARLAVSDKKASDERFLQFLPLIIHGASDARNFVKKAVNWALRQIGKRSLFLNARAVETADKIKVSGLPSGKWVAQDALRELLSEPVQSRLRARLRSLRGGPEGCS